MTAHGTLDADLAQRVELVDEDDAGRFGLGLREQVPHARRADADEHLDEFRAAQTEERHLRFSRDRAREQRLAGAGRTDEQHALGNAAAKLRVLSWILQELDDLLQLLLGFVDARHVREAHLHIVFGKHLGLAAGKRHHAALGSAHAPEEEPPDRQEEDDGDGPSENFRKPAAHQLAGVLDPVRVELLDEFGVLDPGRGEVAGAIVFALQHAANRGLSDGDFGNLAAPHELLELAVRDLPPRRREKPGLRQHHQEQESEHVPDCASRPRARPDRAAIPGPPIAGVQAGRNSWVRHLDLTS